MDDVTKAATTYRRDLAKTARSRETLYDAIRAGLNAGRPQADIARAAGFTRETIRKIAHNTLDRRTSNV